MQIFISHSSKNMNYGNALVDLLIAVGINGNDIIFTSNDAHGIPIGKNIFNWLKDKINEKHYVIYLLSPEYYKSVACLNEMGAAWVVENDHTMIFTPNFDLNSYEFQNGAIDPREIGFYINNEDKLTAFIESLRQTFTIVDNHVLINQKIRLFKEQLDSFLTSEKSKKVKATQTKEKKGTIEAKENTTKTIKNSSSKTIEYGVSIDIDGKHIISVAPTVFFSHRIGNAFPGIRGLEWFDNPKEAVDRLEILLKKPTSFEKTSGYGVSDEPIWWSRGYSDLPIPSFKRISETKCIMDIEELEIDKIAVYHSTRYWQSFVYVEVKAEKQIGLYNYSDEEIKTRVEEYGYFSEEYGLFEDVPITRSCFDDGAAEIGGKVVDTSGAELRVRYLSKYNFLISSRFSPIDCREFENYSEVEMNKILKGSNTVENLLEFIIKLPRNENDD